MTASRRTATATWTTRAAVAVVAIALAAGCSSGDEASPRSGPTTAAPTTVCTSDGTCEQPSGEGSTLRTPDTLPGGDFPAVDRPPPRGDLGRTGVKLTRVGQVEAPTALVARPGHPDQVFIAERAGRVLLGRLPTGGSGGGEISARPLLDISSEVATEGEEGLLGLAFDRTGDVLYIDYNVKGGDSRVDAVAVSDGPGGPTLDTKRTNILGVDQPDHPNHKGGDLAFGPDGYLYLGFGDGGGQGDPDQRAQDPHQLLGKILRIDPAEPSADRAYGIPEGNPFATGGGAPEVWMVGLRNPWRFTFDTATGDMWIADVGQNEREEVDRIPAGMSAGLNLGWSGYEGTKVFEDDRRPTRSVPPVYEELHSDGSCAITGGVVYRGKRIPALQGRYLFADLCRAGVGALEVEADKGSIGEVVDHARLPGTDGAVQVISFGTDAAGEVYALSLGGSIWRLDPA